MTAFDIVIAGGGPAGIASAITASRAGARVLLLERGSYPRQKVCGEFISAESLGLLRSLFAETPDAIQALDAAPRIERARVFVRERKFEARISPAAASLARYDLDALLWTAAKKAGVEVRERAEVNSHHGEHEDPRRFGINLASGDRVQAAVMINAAGRSSRLAPQASGEKWIGIKAHFRSRESVATTDLYCFDGGYCGVQPVRSGEETLVNVCALVRPERARSIGDVLACDERLREASREWEQACDTVTTGTVAFRTPETRRDAAFLVGDAAGFIDPFVGDGIAIALRSGGMAGEIAARVSRGVLSLEEGHAEYAKRYHAAFDGAFRNARRLRKMLDLPGVARTALIAMLKFPGAAEMIVKSTRSA